MLLLLLATETSQVAKRSRITRVNQATEQPEIRKGSAAIPVPPVVRRTAGVKTRSAAKSSSHTITTTKVRVS